VNVLVSAASKHGSTAEIARVIADTLLDAGLQAVVLQPDDVEVLGGYDAVVLGSAIYAGRWLGPMKRLVERHEAALQARPVWLFSSGPAGDPLKPQGEPADVAQIRAKTGARDHQVFPGQIDRRRLGLVERAMVAAVNAPDGDFRSWESVRAWAVGIGVTLKKGIGAIDAP
jgi:menaquinone-dependent protoporphyrinogen oxidase